jgi:hypothetical protein
MEYEPHIPSNWAEEKPSESEAVLASLLEAGTITEDDILKAGGRLPQTTKDLVNVIQSLFGAPNEAPEYIREGQLEHTWTRPQHQKWLEKLQHLRVRLNCGVTQDEDLALLISRATEVARRCPASLITLALAIRKRGTAFEEWLSVEVSPDD